MKRYSLFSFLVIIIFLSACAASVESEQKSWERNLKQIEELASKYPAYGELLVSEQEKAQKVMDEAKGISDEEKKIEKMKEANDIVEAQFIQDLVAIEYKIDGVQKQIDKAYEMKFSKSDLSKVESAIEDATETLLKAEEILDEGGSSVDVVSTPLRDITGELITAESNIKRYTKKKKKKK